MIKVLLAFLAQTVIIFNGGQMIIAPSTGFETYVPGRPENPEYQERHLNCSLLTISIFLRRN